jgi:hypothetical protein
MSSKYRAIVLIKSKEQSGKKKNEGGIQFLAESAPAQYLFSVLLLLLYSIDRQVSIMKESM